MGSLGQGISAESRDSGGWGLSSTTWSMIQKFWTQKLRWAPWLAGILCVCYHSYGREEVMSFMAPQGEDSQKLHTFPDLDPLCLFLWRVLICIANFNKYDYQCHSFQGDFPDGNPPAKAGDTDSILGTERSLGRGNGNPVQYFCLRNPIDRGAWWAIVQRVLKSWTWLSD